MKFRKTTPQKLLIPLIFFVFIQGAWALRSQEKPLKERIGVAKMLFVGKVVNRIIEGDWIHAELLVEKPLRGVKKGQKIKVIWRATTGGRPIYDAAEGARGIALLKDKHQGRFWLRKDKFEDLKRLDEVMKWKWLVKK